MHLSDNDIRVGPELLVRGAVDATHAEVDDNDGAKRLQHDELDHRLDHQRNCVCIAADAADFVALRTLYTA